MAIPESLRLALETPIFETAAFLLGLVVGSFANVVIHRLPRGQSVVTPPSRCPACGALVRPFDNVPVLSYLLLLGRCRSCRARISPRYPAVEAANGLAYLLLAIQRGPTFPTLVAMALVTALLVLSLIDLDHQILPDAITLPGVAAGLVTSPLGAASASGADGALAVLGGLSAMAWIGMATGWNNRRDGDAPMRPDGKMVAMLAAFFLWQYAVLGTTSEPALAATLGYLALFSVAWAYKRFRGVEGLGEGDWKMVAMLGAFLGGQKMLLTVFLASLVGTAVGLVLVTARGGTTFKSKLPLGTFLGGAGILVVLAGDPILAWYRERLGV